MNTHLPKILVLDDDLTAAEAIARALRTSFCEVVPVSSPREAIDLVIRETIAVLICPEMVRGEPGVELMAQARRLSPETASIAMLERADPATLLDCVNVAGVFRCLVQPSNSATLASHVSDALAEHQRRGVLLDLIHAASSLSLIHRADARWES